MNKKILIALAVSVMLNCSFIGYQVARCTGPKHRGIPAKREAIKEMPGNKVFQEAMKEATKSYEKDMKAMKIEVDKAVMAEPFDVEKVKEVMQKASEQRAKIDAAVQENIIKILEKMSPEERKAFVEKSEKRREARGKEEGRRETRGKEEGRRDGRGKEMRGEKRPPCGCDKCKGKGKEEGRRDGRGHEMRGEKRPPCGCDKCKGKGKEEGRRDGCGHEMRGEKRPPCPHKGNPEDKEMRGEKRPPCPHKGNPSEVNAEGNQVGVKPPCPCKGKGKPNGEKPCKKGAIEGRAFHHPRTTSADGIVISETTAVDESGKTVSTYIEKVVSNEQGDVAAGEVVIVTQDGSVKNVSGTVGRVTKQKNKPKK